MTDESQVVTGTATASADAAQQAVQSGTTPATTGETKPDAASDTAQAPRKTDPRQKKIAELSYQNREMQRQIDRLLGVVEKTATRQNQPADQPPKMSDFSTVEEYLDARDAYAEKRHTHSQKPAEGRTDQHSHQYQQAVEAARNDLMSSGAEKYEDFEEVVTDDSVKITPVMRDAIFELDDQAIQADVAYYLGKNPKEALRISRLSPIRQIAEIGKLEMKLSSTPSPSKRPSAAPAPITPVSGGNTASDEIQETEDFKSFLKKRNKQLGRG